MVWKSILGWALGVAICAIIMLITTQLNTERSTLLWGYGSLGSVTVFAVTMFFQIRKKEMDNIDERLKGKAEISDIKRLETSIQQISTNQEEAHATMENIYNILIEWKHKN